ncbi:hypothetical protein EDB87DRAFT_1580091 [Lactarius vividus]|nr:hypothetical protein EDB87DRAFT_1580091 [Lactarius vividus]
MSMYTPEHPPPPVSPAIISNVSTDLATAERVDHPETSRSWRGTSIWVAILIVFVGCAELGAKGRNEPVPSNRQYSQPLDAGQGMNAVSAVVVTPEPHAQLVSLEAPTASPGVDYTVSEVFVFIALHRRDQPRKLGGYGENIEGHDMGARREMEHIHWPVAQWPLGVKHRCTFKFSVVSEP